MGSEAALSSLPLNASPSPTSLKRKSESEHLPSRKGNKATRTPKQKKAKLAHSAETETQQNAWETSIQGMDGHALADLLSRRLHRLDENLSDVEREDRYLPAKAFLDTSSWGKERTLENLPDFLEKYSGQQPSRAALSSTPKATSSPHTIVIAASGLRSADVVRTLRQFESEGAKVAKLFAKHIKLQQAKHFVETTRFGFAVGTPLRIADLLDSGSLLLNELKRVIVDVSHTDLKRRRIIDMRETALPLLALLNRPILKEGFVQPEKQLDLIFY